MLELLQVPFVGPVLPATVLVGVVLVWSLIALVSGIGLEWGLDLDMGDAELGSGPVKSVLSWLVGGYSPMMLRWLNLGHVPLVVWGAILAVIWWGVSGLLWIAVDQFWFAPSLGWSIVLASRNLILALLLTKLTTVPLRRLFVTGKVTPRTLIGRECTISSTEATPEFGLVKFKTGGAPLLLNVRTDGPHLVRGTAVWITHYDAERRVYIVSPTATRGVDAAAEELRWEENSSD